MANCHEEFDYELAFFIDFPLPLLFPLLLPSHKHTHTNTQTDRYTPNPCETHAVLPPNHHTFQINWVEVKEKKILRDFESLAGIWSAWCVWAFGPVCVCDPNFGTSLV